MDEVEKLKAENDALRKRMEKLEEQVNPPPRPASTWQPRDLTEGASMPRSAMKAMVDALPSSFFSDLRADARKPNPAAASTSIVASTPSMQSQPAQRGTGWVPERGFPDRTKEFELMDQIVEKMVGGPNDPVK